MFAYFNQGSKNRRRRMIVSKLPAPSVALTAIERDCLRRATTQEGCFYPTGLDSASTEVIKRQLVRKGYIALEGGEPRITPAGIAALKT